VDAAERLRAAAAHAGGHATLFRAPASGLPTGFARRAAVSGPLATIEQRLREAFDPAGIFNPGRLG
jgi:glycolate oxidase FAD binding subunit